LSIWQKIDNNILAMLKEQKAFEEETVKRLTPFYNSMKHPLVKSFIHRIILDTMKHSDMYQTLIDINERVLVGDIDRNVMFKELSTHVKEENEMVNRAITISKSIKDENFKKLIESIIEDERRHHKILEELFKIIKIEGEDWNRYLYNIMKDYPSRTTEKILKT
jgi:rubrerythrin